MMLSKSIREIIAVALTLLLFISVAGNLRDAIIVRGLQNDDVVMMDTVRHTNYTGQMTNTFAQITTTSTIARIQPVSRGNQQVSQASILTKEEVDPIIKQALAQCNTYGYVTASLVHSVIDQESDYRTNVVSVANAKGIMQLMPETFQYYVELYPDKFRNDNIFNVYNNICAGILYLNDCYKAWESTATSVEDLTLLALASYNVGVTGLKMQYNIDDANELKRSKEFPSKYAKQVLDRVSSR